MSKHLLLFLLISSISNFDVGLRDGEKDAIDLKISTQFEYDKEKNKFKFFYNSPGNSYLGFYFYKDYPKMYLTNPLNNKTEINSYSPVKLESNGTYLFETKCESIFCELGRKFSIGFFGSHTETIDLSQNYYFQQVNIYHLNEYLGSTRYIVKGLQKDTIIYFIQLDYNNYNYYYPYDPDNPDKPAVNNLTIFDVLDTSTGERHKNLKIFEFKVGHEYNINIHCLKSYSDERSFYYSRFMFFSIAKSNMKAITGEGEFFMSNDIIYGVANSKSGKDYYLFVEEEMDITSLYYAKTNETIDDLFKDIKKFSNFNFQSGSEIPIGKEEKENTIFIAFPKNFNYDSKIKLYVVNEIIQKNSPSYYVPANTAIIIHLEREDERSEQAGYFNYITTYKYQYKNMRISFSNDEEMTDYIIQNKLPLCIYVSKLDKDFTITTSSYSPKFSFFGAENPYLFNAFYDLVVNMYTFNIKNYVKLTQINGRIGSIYLPWFEFYNAYLKQLNLKINIYIKQLYGGSELYECNADDFDEKQLTPLMTPISNAKCKDKKSLFNRVWSLSGTRIISGYLTPDSYYDAYVEIQNDENHVINLSPLMEENLRMNNNAKYLKKDIEYKINFDLDHLIKLEPGFNAEIVISNGVQTHKINSQEPTVPVKGNSYTIKSNNDAMVYFYGRINAQYTQIAIDIEKSKGKIIKINNGDFIMDFGFEGYNFSNANVFFEGKRSNDNIIYLDNIYDKLKVKLVPNEKFYIYAPKKDIEKLSIEYIDENLNNANNDYNIFLVPANNKNNSLIIKTGEIRKIFADFKLCQKDTTFNFWKDKEYYIYTNSNITSLQELKLSRYVGNKLTFQTNKEFIFTYSFYDVIDELFEKDKKAYYNERSVFDKLIIDEISDKNNTDNVIKIKFNPNYKQSSTRYIILIAQKNNENTFDKFKDPCFIVNLLNRKPQGVLTDVIYDVGETSLIEAEVDISNILNDKNEYLINIISQELRFDKKINFYEPKEFTHSGKTNNGSGLKGASLALAIVTPILGVIIIVLVIIIILLKRKASTSNQIESLSPLKNMD